MAESNQISRKRMRFSSSSATEILTNRKMQNAASRAASHIGNGFRLNQSASLSGKIVSKVTRTYPRVTIKDLRHRRVFSPNSVTTDWEFKSKAKEQDDQSPCESHSSKIAKEGKQINGSELGNSGEDLEVEDCIETTPPDCELLSNGSILADRVCESVVVKKSGANPCNKSVLHPCSRAKIFKNPASFSYKRLLPYLMQAADDGTSSDRSSIPEKTFGQVPPNVSLSCCNKEKENGVTAEDPKEEVSELVTAKCQPPETTKPISLSVDSDFKQPLAASICGSTSPLKRFISSSPSKKPACSRRKLFKTPGSVNYRRMLPYLRDIQVDNPCLPETDHQKNKEEDTSSSTLVSENEVIQETVTSNVATESDTCLNEDNEPFPAELVSVSPEPSDSDKEQETQVKHVIPDTEKNLESPQDVLGSEVPLSPPLVGSRNSSEVASSPLNNTCVDALVAGDVMSAEKTEAKKSAEQAEAISLDITTELLGSCDILATPSSISPTKGILKRSIRGCRGICSCLNCSSFRLNAERAFEFSRNQLQDTEVMVLDLVGEISHLRDMLGKYASAGHNDSSQSQAGEAVNRASEAAELAKSRLHQMNDDLQVHCRIPNEQRARVKFAHYVYEKTILKASERNKLIRSPF